MDEPHLLLVVILLVWAAECSFWLQGDAVAVMRTLGGWRFTAPSVNRGGERGALTFGGFLPGVALEFIAVDWLSHPALSDAASRRDGSIERWANEVTLDGGERVCLPTVRTAAAFADLAGALREAGPAERAGLVAAAHEGALDESEILDRVDRLSRFRVLTFLSGAQALWIFAGAPITVSIYGFAQTGIPIIAATLALDIAIAGLFFRAYGLLIPEDRFGRWSAAATMVLSPASAVAAGRYLSRPLLGDMHPVAAIGAFCDSEELLRYTRRYLWNRPPDDAAVAPVLAYLESRGIRDTDLRRVPPRQDSSCASYCPRCETQYVISAGTCNDCTAPLEPFSAA